MSGNSTQNCDKGFASKTAEYFKDPKKIINFYNELPSKFPDALSFIIKELDIKEDKLAEEVEVNVRTIQRLCTDLFQNPSMETVIKICRVIALPAMISIALLDRFGKSIRESTVDVIYLYLITERVGASMEEDDQFLIDNKYLPLSKDARREERKKLNKKGKGLT